jgi:7-cyano-7-deazaguanine synthase
VIVLTSGGLDSSILLAEEAQKKRKVYPVFIQTGLRFEDAQARALLRFIRRLKKKNIAPLTRLSLPVSSLFAGRHWALSGKKIPPLKSPDGSCYLPGWNLLLLAPVLTFAAQKGIEVIRLGHIAHNPYPDGQAAFFKAMERVGSEAFTRRIRIERPYERLKKNAVLRRGRRFPLGWTLTCIDPRKGRHCGRCHKCAERHRGFLAAKIPDPTFYWKPMKL